MDEVTEFNTRDEEQSEDEFEEEVKNWSKVPVPPTPKKIQHVITGA